MNNTRQMTVPCPRRTVLHLAGSIAALLAVPSAQAANRTWNGTNDSFWANGANWSGGAPGTGDTATFNNAGNGNTTIGLGGGVTVGTVVFDTANAAAYTVGPTVSKIL